MSGEAVELKESGPFRVASVESTGPYDEVGRVLMSLFGWVLKRRTRVVSYPMALFPLEPEEGGEGKGRFEACVPVDDEEDMRCDDGVTIREVPAMLVASSRHHGPLTEVGRTYDRILAWIDHNGYAAVGPTRELYLTNPMQFEEQDLVTEIQVPVEPKN